jgi:hypothetical protein
MLVFFTPLLIGAAFHGAIDAILRLIGMVTRRKKEPELRNEVVDDLLRAMDEE